MMDWKNYAGDRLIAHHADGYYVIRPQELSQSGRPIFCPHCNSIMCSSYDDDAYDKFECCDTCANVWVYPNLDKWKSGWRPSSEELTNKLK